MWSTSSPRTKAAACLAAASVPWTNQFKYSAQEHNNSPYGAKYAGSDLQNSTGFVDKITQAI